MRSANLSVEFLIGEDWTNLSTKMPCFYSNTFISHGGGWQQWRDPNIISASNVAFADGLKSALDMCSSGVSQRFGQNISTETLVLLLWLSHPLNTSLHSPGIWLQQTVP